MTCSRRVVVMRSSQLLLTAMLVALCVTAPASAQGPDNNCWTSVGSGGTVDDADLDQFTTNLNAVGVRSALSSATVLVRYNVTAVDGVFVDGKELRVRYTDNGAGARVVARLRQVNINTGSGATLAELDSDDFAQSPNPQTQAMTICGSPELDFATFAYFVEVTLVKTASSGTPDVRALRLCGGVSCS